MARMTLVKLDDGTYDTDFGRKAVVTFGMLQIGLPCGSKAESFLLVSTGAKIPHEKLQTTGTVTATKSDEPEPNSEPEPSDNVPGLGYDGCLCARAIILQTIDVV
jgi:hypothetical protein